MKKPGRARLLLGGLLALGWFTSDTRVDAQAVAPTHYPSIQQTGFRMGWRREPACCPPVIISPPSVVSPSPIDPKVDPKADPGFEPKLDPSAALPSDPFAQLSPSGGLSGQNIAPNMFGDQFGSGPSRVRIAGRLFSLGVADPNPNNPLAASFGPATVVSRVIQSGSSFFYVNLPTGFNVSAPNPLFFNRIPSPPGNGDFPVVNAPVDINGDGVPDYLGLANNLGLAGMYDALSTSTITPSGHVLLNIFPVQVFDVSNPAGGGVVGRVKVSEDSSPLPRDRFIFNYDYFNNVPLTPGGQTVNRFAVGIEKTFLDGMMSVEARLPFASTLSSDGIVGSQSTNTELGNLHMMIKALLYRTDQFAIASGLGISLPTASDTRIRFTDGTDLIQIRNETVLLEPYLAALWTPNERLFSQLWFSVPFDTCGNPVHVNLFGGGLRQVGTLQEQTRVVLEGQLGYWVVRNDNDPTRALRGLAPFVELHYSTTTADPDVVASNGFAIGDLSGRVDELNLTAGVTSQLSNNFFLSVGLVTPLRDQDDRTFDYQVGVRANLFFGPTARQMDPLLRASMFR